MLKLQSAIKGENCTLVHTYIHVAMINSKCLKENGYRLSMQILTVNEAIVPRSSHSSEAVDPLISCHEIGCAAVLSH